MIVKHARKWFFPAKNREVVTDEKENASRCVAAFGAADAAWHHPAGGVCRRGTDGDFHRRGGPPENGNSIAPTVSDDKAIVASNNQEYDSLDEAMDAAVNGDTIYLGAGVYCGNAANPTQAGKGAGKSLTFVGAGTDKTTWQIKAPATQYGSDGWCDYSFKNSDSITFEDMTVIGSVYLPDDTTKTDNT